MDDRSIYDCAICPDIVKFTKCCRNALTGDGSLPESDAATYPRDVPVICEAYQRWPHAAQAMRLSRLVESGSINLYDEADSWYVQAIECVAASRARIQIARMREASKKHG